MLQVGQKVHEGCANGQQWCMGYIYGEAGRQAGVQHRAAAAISHPITHRWQIAVGVAHALEAHDCHLTSHIVISRWSVCCCIARSLTASCVVSACRASEPRCKLSGKMSPPRRLCGFPGGLL